MIDKKLQKRIQNWLESPADSRNIEEGALCLLKLNRNQVMYRNAVMRPEKYAAHIEYQLKKYYNKEVIEVTHAQVEEMAKKVEKIESDHLTLPESNPAKVEGTALTAGASTTFGVTLPDGAAPDPTALANDISFALITTALGLTIAIPLIISLAAINIRIRKMEDLVSSGMTRFMETFKDAMKNEK